MNCAFQEHRRQDITENGILLFIYWEEVLKVAMEEEMWRST